MKSVLIVVQKKRLIIFFLALLLILIAANLLITAVFPHNNELDGKVIVVDAGHGGVDGGTNNKFILEKDVNLDVALKLQKRLEDSGARVIMTRTTDTDLGNYHKIDRQRYRRDLRARLDLINNSSADMFVSIHTNSNKNNYSARGMITYYYNSHPHNRGMAYIFQNVFNSYGFEYEGKVYKSYHFPQSGKYYLLVCSKIPGVIVETGFITNHIDLALLQKNEYREYLSEAIYKGITDYFLCRNDMLDNSSSQNSQNKNNANILKAIFDLGIINKERIGDVLFFIGTILAFISANQEERSIIQQLSSQEAPPPVSDALKTITIASWLFFTASIIFAITSYKRLQEQIAEMPANASQSSRRNLYGREVTTLGNFIKIIGF